MAQRATSLGPKPSLFIFVVFVVLFFFGFVFWLFNTEKNLVFPQKRAFFCLFSVFLFLSPLALLGLPLFLFLFLCLSCFFFSFFLPSCLCCCFLLVPCFCPFFVSFSFFFAFLSWKEQHENIKLQVFCLKSFLFLSYLPFFLSSSFFLSLLFPDFKLCFLFNIKVFGFKTKNLKKNKNVWSKGGLQQNGFFFINLCFGKCQKLSFFWPCFWQFLVDAQKHYKNRYFNTFLKPKNWKKGPFLMVNNWATLMVNNWATFVPLKNRQRGPVINH